MLNLFFSQEHPVPQLAPSRWCASSLFGNLEPSVSTHSHIQEIIQDVYEKYKDIDEGEVATYIPELAKADPDHFGIAMVTVDGQMCSAGDCEQEFTIQSICKPFAFQIALEEFGRDRTLEHVGVEPSGDAFNSIEL